MIFKFNVAQLSRCQQKSLMDVLGVIQHENSVELVVMPVEFPKKLKVKLDNAEEMLLVWDDDGKHTYAELTTPEVEPEPEPEKLGVGAMMESPKPESELFGYMDMAGKFTPANDSHSDIDPMRLARLKYELMSAHLVMPDEQKIIFAKEYSRLWSEHR